MPGNSPYRVVVIGAGFGGIGMGIALRRAGIEDFLIVDKGDGPGGTWRDNTYPGAACDVPAHLYSFSFRPGRWSGRFPPQREILAYLCDLAEENGLGPHLRLGSGVTACRFDEGRALWDLTLGNGDTIQASAVVSAVGQLNRPALPDIAGRGDFAGPSWHSARWDHGADLDGQARGRRGHRGQRDPVRARDRQDRRPRGRLPAHPALRAAQDRPALRRGRAGLLRPVPGGAQGRPAAHLPLRRVAHQRLRPVAQAPGGTDATVAPPAQHADHRPGAARQVRPRLRDGLQAGAVLQRLVSGAGPPERGPRHRPDRAHRRRRRGHHRTAPPATRMRSSTAPGSRPSTSWRPWR